MNENQVKNLLSRHGDEILTRRPFPKAKRQKAWKPILVSCTAIVSMGAFLLLPKNAEAAKIVRIKKAMRNARSVETRTFYQTNNLAWHPLGYRIAQPGRSKQVIAIGTNSEATLIYDSRQTIMGYTQLPFASLWKSGPITRSQVEEIEDPLATALSALDGNPDPKMYSLKASNGKNGTYFIEYVRNLPGVIGSSTSLHVLVDEFSNLPIQSIQTTKYDWGIQKLRTEYVYGKTYSQSEFVLTPPKKIYDTEEQQRRFKDSWESGNAAADSTPIYSASMTPDGTIWVAYGVDRVVGDTPLKSLPVGINTGSAKYILASDFPISSYSVSNNFRVNGKEVVFAIFVPLYQPAPINSSFSLLSATRKLNQTAEDESEPTIHPLKVVSESLAIPECLIGFGAQKEIFRKPMALWRKKAEAREALGDLRGAIQAYEGEIKAYENFVFYSSYRPMLKAADCYEKLGQADKAKELRDKAAELQRTRIR